MQKQLLLLLLFCTPFCLPGQLLINEVCSDNESIIQDEFGKESDWIELYNSSSTPINLSGYFLSDTKDNPQKWVFPDITINANSYLLIFASEKDVYDTYLHTNFKLSKDGESLLLSNANGDILDQIIIPSLEDDHSFGRSFNNMAEWFYYSMPTPGFVNNNNFAYQYNNKPVFTLMKTFHEVPASIELLCDAPNCQIRYTTDGSPPTDTALLYTAPLILDSTVCIRARTFSDDLLPSKVSTKTYFYNVTHELPVMALSTDPYLLYDWEEGILVKGPDADSLYPFFGANFWKDITRPLHIEYFKEQELLANYDIGTRVHGGRGSRSKPMKSLRLIADAKYGDDEMDYPFFEDRESGTYKRMILRNASGDFNFTHFRDAYLHRYFIEEGLHVDVLAYQPVVAYINGEYWGLINLREKMDRYYLRNNHGIDVNNVDILEEDTFAVTGSFELFDQMRGFVISSDMADDANLAIAEKNFDFKNIMDYVIIQTAVNNFDWPGNNLKYWRERKEGSKWRYVLFDMDVCMGRAPWSEADDNSIYNFMNLERFNDNNLVSLFKGLLQNQNFKHDFLNRYADLLNTTFRSENLLAETAKTEAALDREMFLHIEEWNWPGYDVWLTDRLPTLYNFARDRPPYAREFLMKEFDLENEVALKLNVFPPEAGTIQINTITPDELPWDGYYFNGVPVTLTIIPNTGFTFKHWESVHTILTPDTSPKVKLNFTRDDEITAFFESEEVPFEARILPNPVGDEVNVHFLLDEISSVSVKLYDISGRLLQTHDFGRVGGGQQELGIDVADLVPGVYLMEVRAGEERSVKKVFK